MVSVRLTGDEGTLKGGPVGAHIEAFAIVSICFNKTPLQFDHPFITCHQFWRHFRTPLVTKRHQTLDPPGVFRFLDFLDPLAGYETRFLTPPQGGSDKFFRPPLRGV